MSQWFHRNPFKASGKPNYELGPVTTNIPSRMLCRYIWISITFLLSHLAERREVLIRMLGDFNNSREAMVDATNQYVSLLMGFATTPGSEELVMTEDESDDGDDVEDVKREAIEPGVSDSTEAKANKKEKKKLQKKGETSAHNVKKAESLRSLISYTWTDSLDLKHRSPTLASIFYWYFVNRTLCDVNFELVGIIFNVALWFSKHAAKIASCEK